MRISDWSSDVCSSDLTTPAKTPSAASPKTKRFDAGPKKKRPDPRHPRPARRAASPPRSNDMATQESTVPDIGGYADVPVSEVLVAVGDDVDKDQGRVTRASEKATMEEHSSGARGEKEPQ